jgi:hypothetical protein
MDRLAEMDQYDSMFGRQLVDDDFLAAGYTPQEVQAYRGEPVQSSLTSQDMASIEARYGSLQQPDPTLRQRGSARVQDALIERGVNPYLAGSYGRRIMGDTAPTDGGLGIGLADLTPMGAVFGAQEGSRTAARGYQQGDPLQMGLGVLEAGLGLLEATPLTKAVGRGISEATSKMDPNTLYSVFGPPVGARSPFDMGRGVSDNPANGVAAPREYERFGSNVAENLTGIPSASEIAGRGETMPGAGLTNIKSQKPTALSGSYSRGFTDPELVAPLQSSISDLEGRTLMGIVGDTSGRQRVTQVNQDVFETPVDTQGGFQYMDRPGQGYAGAQTATSSKLNEASKTKDPFYISVLMGEQSPDFAVPTSKIFGQMLRNAPIAAKNVSAIDEAIRGVGMSVVRNKVVDGKPVKYSETIYPFGDFKSIGTPGYFDEYVAGLPSGTQRAALLKGLDKSTLQKMGLPKVSDARAAMMDEAQIGMDWGSTGYRGFTPDIERGAFKTTPDQSLTYQSGVDKVGPARTLTGEGRGIPYALTFPDLSSELRAKGTGGGLEMTSPAYKVFEGSPKRAKQRVTPLVVDLVSTFREIEDRAGRKSAMQFAADTLKDVKVTKEMIEAARRANAPTWMIAAMSSAGAMSATKDDKGV